MHYKRITIISGHYGSGKTNIAVNLAFELKKSGRNVAIADLDIVNPYFRAYDSKDELLKAGIKIIASEFVNTNLDIPSLPQDIYSIVDNKNMDVIIDLGGDELGALALGSIGDAIMAENNYDMLFVVNKYRPLTKDLDGAMEIMREIEGVSKVRFTGIINNSNLAGETKKYDIIDSLKYADEISKASFLPIVLTTVSEQVYSECVGCIDNLFSLNVKKFY